MPTQPPTSGSSANKPTQGAVQVQQAVSKQARLVNPQVPQTDKTELASGEQAFSAAIYQQLRAGQDGNLFFSPFSIQLALAMTYAGAKGQTANQMAQALHFTLPPDRLHPAFNTLDQALELTNQTPNAPTPSPDTPEPFQLSIANSIWAQKDFDFQQAFLDLLAQNYGAGLQLVDFQNAPEPARQAINNWVSQKTHDKIKDLFPEGTINTDTRLALANAIYFKAAWSSSFEGSSTKNGAFHLKDGSQVQVPMMNSQDAADQYLAGNGYQAVALPYFGNQVEMVVVLPDEGKFDALDASLNQAKLAEIFSGLQGQEVNLTMPKFTIESEFDLAKTLADLGMADAFNSSAADFSGMDGKRDLFISDVMHKAYVNVDEKGTEAAAATGVAMSLTSAGAEPQKVTIDRPFLFFIYDNTNNMILFAGRVMNPSK